MGRAVADDYLHAMKYHIVPEADTAFLPAEAGFNSVTTPEMSVELAEYKEGTWTYTQKYAGNPTVSDITLSRGVARADTAFFDWITSAVKGLEYRLNFTIRHYHRDQGTNFLQEAGAREYEVFQAIPIRNKIAGDLDAATSDISIQELDVACEYFELKAEGTKISAK
jgi:phage tail-like protein